MVYVVFMIIMNFNLKLSLIISIFIYEINHIHANSKDEIHHLTRNLLNLNGNDWQFFNENHSINGLATVPGNIFQDLAKNRFINGNFFYENSDQNNSWIGKEIWTFTKKFHFDYTNLSTIILRAESLDTICNLYLNNKWIAYSNNMFIPLEVDIGNIIRQGENNITIVFESSIKISEQLFKQTLKIKGYPVAPSSIPPSLHGLNHVNMIRKMQSSYGWDWGPQFAIAGIINNISIISKSYFDIENILIDTKQVLQKKSINKLNLLEWIIDTSLILKSYIDFNKNITFKFLLNKEEMKVIQTNTYTKVKGSPKRRNILNFKIKPKINYILPWWPNNADYLVQPGNKFFKPNLYNLTVIAYENHLIKNLSQIVAKKHIQFGFREVSLIQDDLNNGSTFYFKINGMPIYMRGINYIPTTLNLGNLEEEESKFTNLLKIIKQSNINMIRVWGGGYYPSEKFYNLADKYGIMIWQDFMFACYLYPANENYLSSVEEEVFHQITRLQHHPSVIILAGNNEIESFLAYNEYNEIKDHINECKNDYNLLFEKYIRLYATSFAKNIPFVTSSPSNNNDKPFINPQNPSTGDIHFYDYDKNCLDEFKYPKARFVSEYGFQSYPSIFTLSKSFKSENLIWPIQPELERRQHSKNMNFKLLEQIQYNIIFKKINETGQEPLEEFIYLTQLIQALAIKLETELYISNRDTDAFIYDGNNIHLRENVENLNMGNLIWQLNDVWPAPSWSSIDVYGKFKLLHYFIQKFYKPVIIILSKQIDNTSKEIFLNNKTEKNLFKIHIISDVYVKIVIMYIIMLYESQDGILFLKNSTVIESLEIKPLTILQFKFKLSDFLNDLGCDNYKKCFIRVHYDYNSLTAQNQKKISADNFCFLGLPNELELKKVQVDIVSIKLIRKLKEDEEKNNSYEFMLNCKHVCLFIQLDFKLSSLIEGHFTENGFNLYNEERKILFFTQDLYDTEYLEKNLQIRSLN